MTVKRHKDPAGLLPDSIEVTADEKGFDFDAAYHAMLKISVGSRIRRLRRHDDLVTTANDLQKRYRAARYTAGPGSPDEKLAYDLAQAEHRALYLDTAATAIREKSRHEGQKEPRGSKMPKLDDWLDEQDLTLPNKTLWRLLPEGGISDPYRDGDKVCEGKQECGIAGFNSRVTAARKRKTAVSN